MKHRLTLVTLSLFFIAATAHRALVQKPAARAPDVDIEATVDDSIAWLRNAQDKLKGSYAGGVEGTAWVLRAIADSPRHYRRIDGPFVAKALEFLAAHAQKDGAICDEGAKEAARVEQTSLAVMALTRHADAASKDVLAAALAFVAKEQGQPAGNDLKLPSTKDEALALTHAIVARRGADNAWDGPKGKVIETARAICVLDAAFDLSEDNAQAHAAAKALPTMAEADRAKTLDAITRGAKFLLSKQEKGVFMAGPGKPNAGYTAMAIGALECVPTPRQKEIQDAIDAGLAWLLKLQKPDGSIHDGQLSNYVTSASILALARSGKSEFKPVIEKARAFLIELQADEAEGFSPDHPFYGGNSYGDEQRPDLSNVQMALEALAASGLDKGNVAYKRALIFLQRCQNRSESNDIKLESDGKTVVSGNDGGSAYAPGVSKAGFIELADGKKVPRSYGSMSYALLKGYIFCGLPKDDPRMKACWDWLCKNYTLDVNPGFETSKDPTASYQGLFYYFHTMAKALDLYGQEEIPDASGKANPWRKQLCGRIVAMQSKVDSSWTNENSPRWMEGNPLLSTCYALLALDAALPR